jgi:hypothetical protein
MPLINVGQSCFPLSPPSGPTGPLYATTTVTTTNPTTSTSYVVGLKTDSAAAYVYAGSSLTIGNLTNINEAKLSFSWDANINVTSGQLTAMGISAPNQPLIVGDSRLRYVTSAAATAPTITIIAYFPDTTDLANCKFINTTMTANLPFGSVDTKIGSNTPTYTLVSTPPSSNPSVPQRYFFLDRTYAAGGPKRYLGQDGNPYDVNQALANLSYIIPFTVATTLSASGVSNRIVDNNLAGNARNAAVPSTSPAFTPNAGWVTINSVDYVATTTLSQDQETIDATALANELDYIILQCVPTPAAAGVATTQSVLGYNSTYGTTLKSSYFAYGSTKYNYGYFIMVPLTTETSGSSSFMLLTGDGAKYLTLTATALSYNDVPAGLLSTLSGSTASYKFLGANYGAWTFESAGANVGFKAKYTPPYATSTAATISASSASVPSSPSDTSTKAGVASPSASVYLKVTISAAAAITAVGDTAANGTVFSCTYCSPSNGMCMPGASAFHGSPVAPRNTIYYYHGADVAKAVQRTDNSNYDITVNLCGASEILISNVPMGGTGNFSGLTYSLTSTSSFTFNTNTFTVTTLATYTDAQNHCS